MKMNIFRKAAQTLAQMLHPGPRVLTLTNYLPRTKFDYETAIGDGLGSNIIMAPVFWMARTFPEAELTVAQIDNSGDEDVIQGHPLVALVDHPNDYYSGVSLWMATIASWVLSGNAYWMKIRNKRTRAVEELWYLPHWYVSPAWNRDGSEFVSYYEYKPSGFEAKEIPPQDIVHFRHGLDPRNPRLGISPIWPVLREVFTDEEAANYTATTFRNMGMPGVVISPMNENVRISDPDAQALKSYLQQKFTGDRRGEPLVMKGATKIEQFGWSPKDMALGDLRDIPEERVCAILGIPAAVVGFGTGLQTTRVGATMRESIGLAWKQCLIPNQRLFADELSRSLLPEFEPQPDRYTVWFDTSDVEALQESENERVTRVTQLVTASVLTVAKAQEMLGLEVDDSQNVYLRSFSVVETPENAPIASEPAPAPLALPPAPAQIEEGQPKALRKADVDNEDALAFDEMLHENPPRTERPGALQRRMMRSLDRERQILEASFDKELAKFFAELGRKAAAIAEKILRESDGKAALSQEEAARLAAELQRRNRLRALSEEETERILRGMQMDAIRNEWTKKGGAFYWKSALRVADVVSAGLGIVINYPDPVQKRILEMGGRRLGLVDLAKQTKDRIFRELMEGRGAGEGVPDLIRRIRDMVPAGPWSSPAIRSRVISRTEALNAQRLSTLESCRVSGVVERVMVFDDRLGYGDEDCSARNGWIVTMEEADQLADVEHINGTMAFVPYLS